MTVLVVVLLLAVWAVVLGPGLVRRRTERHGGDSISAFHRQLHILRQTGPSLVSPAHRLEVVEPAGGVGGSGSAFERRPGLIVIRPDAVPLAAPTGPVPVGPRHRRPDPYFRPEACKRRRDVLVALTATVGATALLAAVVFPVLFVTLAALASLAGYVALLVRGRNLALERETKLHFMPDRAGPAAVLAEAQAVGR